MPIRINLLAEQQAAEELRRRDPVKRALWMGSFFVFLVLLWAAVLQFRMMAANSVIERHTQDWKGIERKFNDISTNQLTTGDLERKLAALQRLATNRFLWGPALHALQSTTTDNVQLVRITTQQTAGVHAATKNKPAFSNEKVSFTLQAKDLNPPSEQKFIEALSANPYFKSHLRKGDGIRLKELGTPQADPANRTRSFVLFSIECLYPDKERS